MKRLCDWQTHSAHLEVQLVRAPYRGNIKLPAEPVVIIVFKCCLQLLFRVV